MKTLIFVANFLIICSAAEDLKVDESVNKPVSIPPGSSLHVHADVPALRDSRPQIDYINTPNDNQDEVKPAIDYISTFPQKIDQGPTVGVQRISQRPVSSYDYINSYPSLGSLSSIYDSYSYSGVPRVSYGIPQRGYQTGYQYIRTPTVIEKQQPLVSSYPGLPGQTYYPFQSLYQYPQYQYGYQYPHYLSHLSTYLQPLQQHYSDYSIFPIKKKK